jgi:bifunctional UDP-N-acetylglucosamine pyrophosphorylase/glucosamine-1-phosphate N-acetyltransferase
MNTMALILAAGKGKRMKSEKSKVLHEINGKSIIEYVVDALDIDEIERIGVIVSEKNIDELSLHLGNRTDFIIQKEQLGTGHAVLSAEGWLSGFVGRIVVVVGDAPFLKKETIRNLLTTFVRQESACVLLSAIFDEPPAYGRVVRGKNGALIKIVEEKDASEDEKKIREVSSSHYCFDKEKLFSALKQINNENVQGEYYLPDVIEIFIRNGEEVKVLTVPDPMITFGINSQEDLLMAERMMLNMG